jgi:glycopeptide antibiotics resistance protein
MRILRRIIESKRAMYALFAVYLVILLRLTVLRDGLLPLHLFQGGVMDLFPLAYYLRWARRSLFWLVVREFAGNTVGFAPLGAFVLWRRPQGGVKGAFLTGAVLSALIETAQYVFGAGRMSTGDVVLNGLGAALGAVIMQRLLCERKEQA